MAVISGWCCSALAVGGGRWWWTCARVGAWVCSCVRVRGCVRAIVCACARARACGYVCHENRIRTAPPPNSPHEQTTPNGCSSEHEGHCSLRWEGVPPVQKPGGSLLPSKDILPFFEKKEGHLLTRGRAGYFQAFRLGGVPNLPPGGVSKPHWGDGGGRRK